MKRRAFLKLPLPLALALLLGWIPWPAQAQPSPGCLPASLPMSLPLGPSLAAKLHLSFLSIIQRQWRPDGN